mmetsp:Transcript_5975/g.6835  ORF Transcript_5975/g.6835 Transcript_5975/m.6835 type:complete len:494 (-) Transcript_5975:791-2272(-)|eukprot:CAMPEP_0197846336 /NCGR_PEP_ID=MMETSP1438-20131217/3094_1 /TAXON_ID=1461541 /ORGANISM="Pterosperma sp., Strain CCMP1384" /LENGTH=493 /DNA_ID=CAMNT_0043457939 /DNA_START=330 /DNA_END=1811 /DNA_ORIENTATION=-
MNYILATYAPTIWLSKFYVSIISVIAWSALHVVVPQSASKALQDPSNSAFTKGLWRCLLSLFHDNSASDVDYKKTDFKVSDSDPSASIDHLATPTRSRSATFNPVTPSKDQRPLRQGRRYSAFQATASMIMLSIKQKRARTKMYIFSALWLENDHLKSELLISFLMPFTIPAPPSAAPASNTFFLIICPRPLISILFAYRLIAPLSNALRVTLEDIVGNMDATVNHGRGLAYLTQKSFLPTLVTSILWTIWAIFTAHSMGFDVSTMVRSLGLSGVLFTLSLQHYAADVVGSMTLLAERRFSTGDMVKFSSDSTWYLVDHVGLLSTRVRLFEGGRYRTYIPNSTVVRATCVNASRVKQRRLTPMVYVDPMTPVAKLKKMPKELLQAVKEGTSDFHSVIYIQEDKGLCCEMRGMNESHGLRFELKVVLAHDPTDTLRWKRYETAANLAMLEYLQMNGIRPGCMRTQRETLTDLPPPVELCDNDIDYDNQAYDGDI